MVEHGCAGKDSWDRLGKPWVATVCPLQFIKWLKVGRALNMTYL